MSMAIARAKYTGDPGFFDWVKKAATVATSFIPVVGGGISQAIAGMGGKPTAGPGSVPLPIVGMAKLGVISGGSTAIAQRARDEIAFRRAGGKARSILLDPLAIMPGGNPFLSLGPVPNGGGGGMPMGMSGYHPNKSSYFLMSGEFVPEGSRMVKNRKRNPANARATSRSIARIKGAKKYAASLSAISIRKKC